MATKLERRQKIKTRIRGKISGSAARPRMTVFRTLASASSKGMTEGTKCEISEKVGELAAKKAMEVGITTVVFDRNGYLYHGRVKSVAEGARKAGLKF